MNTQLIENFAKEAGCTKDKYGLYHSNNEDHGIDLEKFAELILLECVRLKDQLECPVGNSAWGEAYQDGWTEGTLAYKKRIQSQIVITNEITH